MAREQMDQYDEELEKIDIMGVVHDLGRAFRKFFFAILLVVILCGAGSTFWAWKSYVPVYEAYTSFVVKSGKAYSSTYYDNASAEQLGKTFPYIVTSGVLRDVVAQDLGIGAVSSGIRAEAMEGTNLFTIYVQDASPQRAYDVLQSVIENYPQVAEYIMGSTSLTVVDESGVPTSPVNPRNLTKAAIKGILVGVCIAFAFLLIYVTRRKTIRQGDDLKQITSTKFLGNIPETRIKKRSNLKGQILSLDNLKVPSAFKEAVRLMRSRVEKELANMDGKVILVTSAIPGEGKTTVAANLALAFAKKDKKVVLIDGDLRNPSVANALAIKEVKSGIIQVLQGKAEVEDVLINYKSTELLVLPGNSSTSNPFSLIRSSRMKELIRKIREYADYIVIDTPPSAMLSDTAAYSDLADAAIMVVRQDFTGAHQVQRGLENISDAGIPVIGYVLNRVMEGTTGYGYSSFGRYGYRRYGYGGYGYGYGRYGYGKNGYGYGYGQSEEKTKGKKKSEKSGENEETEG
ncbi:MAG: polysaccharide biosynthesis tyrosine autokinase [Fusicatenibacter sp.]